MYGWATKQPEASKIMLAGRRVQRLTRNYEENVNFRIARTSDSGRMQRVGAAKGMIGVNWGSQKRADLSQEITPLRDFPGSSRTAPNPGG
jgi:membrane protease subunit (stomatin/prohibitin family)